MTMWVFGYGSLVWNPGFEPTQRVLAALPDYHRSFCMRSIHHRGTEENPGLVLALDKADGALCRGVALAVHEEQEARVLSYLRDRELISSAYIEKELDILLQDGRQVAALTYVVDASHVQYCGGLDLEEQARIIARAIGGRGPNDEYLYQTNAHLNELGIADRELDWLVSRVRALGA
ncbi:MAG: gamma-glutamylcyclotransferase [Pseudomonadota bacterium]